jgi:hypothetical protein
MRFYTECWSFVRNVKWIKWKTKNHKLSHDYMMKCEMKFGEIKNNIQMIGMEFYFDKPHQWNIFGIFIRNSLTFFSKKIKLSLDTRHDMKIFKPLFLLFSFRNNNVVVVVDKSTFYRKMYTKAAFFLLLPLFFVRASRVLTRICLLFHRYYYFFTYSYCYFFHPFKMKIEWEMWNGTAVWFVLQTPKPKKILFNHK